MNIFEKIKRYRERVKYLKNRGWIKCHTDIGVIYAYIDRYGTRCINKKDILNLDDKDFKNIILYIVY